MAKYAERGILTQVNGISGIEEITMRVMDSYAAAKERNRNRKESAFNKPIIAAL